MACGCTTTCGCNIVAGAGISVNRVGDKFTIVNTGVVSGGVPTFVQSTPPVYADGPYVWWQTDPDTGEIITQYVETEGAP